MDKVERTLIRNVRPGMKNMNIYFIVLEIGDQTKTKDGHTVRNCMIADESGSINMSVWDEPSEVIKHGDVCWMTRAYAAAWKGGLTVYAGKEGGIVKVRDFTMVFSESPNMSEPSTDYNSKE